MNPQFGTHQAVAVVLIIATILGIVHFLIWLKGVMEIRRETEHNSKFLDIVRYPFSKELSWCTLYRTADGEWEWDYSIRKVFDVANKTNVDRGDDKRFSPYSKSDLWEVGVMFGYRMKMEIEKAEAEFKELHQS